LPVGRIRAHDLTDEPTAHPHTNPSNHSMHTGRQAGGTSIITPAMWYGYGVGHRRRTCGEPDHLCRVDPGQEQRREATYCVSQARPPHGARDGWLAPAHHSCRVSFGRENPSEQDRYRAPRAVASTNNSWVRARPIITARGLALHCIERTGRDGRRGAVAAGLVCLSRPCWGGGGRRGRRRRGCPRSTATPGRAAEAGAPSSLFARPCRGSLGSPSPHRLARATVGHGRRPGRCVHCTHTDGSTSGDFVCLVGLGRYSLVPPCEGTGRVAFVEWGLGASFSAVCVSDTYVCIIYTYID
jgi:hypothetical protein